MKTDCLAPWSVLWFARYTLHGLWYLFCFAVVRMLFSRYIFGLEFFSAVHVGGMNVLRGELHIAR